MKKWMRFAVAAVLMLATTTASAKEWKKIRIAVEGAFPPFSQVNPDGSITGFDIDIANALCEEMKAECKLIAHDFDGMIPALMARKFDAVVASMSITEERKKKVDFTDKYYFTPARFMAKKGSITEVNKETLKGKKVGVQRATIHETYLQDNYGGIVEIKSYPTRDDSILDLTAGRLDLVFNDSVTLSHGFLNAEQGKDYEFVGPEYYEEKWFGTGVGIAIRKEDKDLRDQLNAAIKGIRANGNYEKISKKYFDFDIYGK